jgi:hypothetical protein
MAKRKKPKSSIHHPNTRIAASAVDGHQYLVAHKPGQEAEAIKAIDGWVENPELNLTPEQGVAMANKVRGAAAYEAIKTGWKKLGGGK